jgi:hypothetical protein
MDLRESVSAATPSEVVEFNQLTPTTVGVVFTPNTPTTTNVLYVSTVNASTWIYNGSSYVTYTAATLPNTPFYLLGTTIDAGGNKTAAIQHLGPLRATTLTGNGINITGINAANLETGVVSVNRLGSSGTRDNTTYLRGDNTWATIASGGKIGIPNQTTGIPTYYSTLELAATAAVSGDTIYVNPGTYTITTTATNGIAKSGVNYVFAPGCIINKSSAGDMFNDNGFSLPCNVFGEAVFNKTTTTGNISSISKSYSVFECYTFSVTNGTGIDVSGSYSKVSFVYGISTGSRGLFIGAAYCNINFVHIKSTASEAIFFQSGSNNSMITGNLVESTATRSIYVNGATGIICNVDYVTGTTDSFSAYAASSLVFNGNTDYLYIFSSNMTFNGYATTLKSSGIINGGARCGSLIVNGDYGNNGAVSVTMQGNNLSINVSAGIANVRLPKACTYLATTVSGGVLNFENTRLEDGYYYGVSSDFLISGGRVNLNNLQSELVDRSYSFKLTGGILDLGSSRIKNTSSALIPYVANGARQSGIYWTGGTIISNGARIITANDDCLAIQAVSTGLSMKVLSSGFNTTNTTSITTAKKQKVKCTVSSVLSTSVTLNDGSGGNEIFTEANTGIYNTVALLALRMVSLINASATLDITASQDISGTDAYFYLESDVSGTAFTIPASANIVTALVRPNSNAFTVLCGGLIIQDINID